MPDRRVGSQQKFQALYGEGKPAEVLLATHQNARPIGRPLSAIAKGNRLPGSGALPGALRA
jgi:hypothetical protein